MDYDLWEPKRRIEERYRKSILETMKHIEKLLEGIEDPYEIVRRLRRLVATKYFSQYAEASAAKMVTSLFSDAGRTWRQAARANSKGRAIYDALRNELMGPVGGSVMAQIQRNAGIIKTLPLEISRDVTKYISEEAFKGRRASDIAQEIQSMFPEASRAKANLIARTEVSKTSTALTRARAENIGLGWYVWRTSQDSRVRDSHKIMEGVLVKWTDPPSPELLDGQKHISYYHAGEIFYCCCYPEPLVTMDIIKWPHKAYSGGTIQMMTRTQFEQIAA